MNNLLIVGIALAVGLIGQFVTKNKKARRHLTWTTVVSISALCYLGKESQVAFCVLAIGAFLGICTDLFDLRGQKQI